MFSIEAEYFENREFVNLLFFFDFSKDLKCSHKLFATTTTHNLMFLEYETELSNPLYNHV